MSVNTEPAWYQDMVTANQEYAFRNDMPNNITMIAGSEEMLKVGPNGFWVRGVKVEQDEHEAKNVYEGFKAWMAWAQLTRDYK